jgi:cell fate regulator YaaT (PSP1 superfamily)
MTKEQKDIEILVKLRNKRDQFIVRIPESTKLEKLEKHDQLILENADGLEIGFVCTVKFQNSVALPELKFVRIANLSDIAQLHKIQQLEEEFAQNFKDKIDEYKISMKLISSELSFDEKRLTFYFTAASRIDFRQLLKDLVATCHKLIRLEQIGSRDAIRINEDYMGPCGRQVCCQTFLGNIKNINLDMVRNNNLKGSQSPKLSGCCGKLMCCLMYDKEHIKISDSEPLDKQK